MSALERALGPGLQSSYVLAFSSASHFAPDELFAAPADSPTDIHVWVNATTQGIARLYFVNRDGTRDLVRTLEVSQTIDEMDSESLAQVIEWSLQALVDGNAGITRAEAKSLLREASPPVPLAVLPPTTESASPSSRWRPVTSGWLPELALLHGWTMLSAELPAAQGPVLRFGFDRLDPRRQFGIALSGQYQFPQRHADLGVALQLQSMAWRLDARYLATGLIDGAAIGLRVGPGFDVVFSSAEALDYDRFDAVQNKVSTVPLVTGGIVFQLRAESRVRLELSLGIEIDLI
ncbi:MAG TPA: hypothetical protein VLC09_04615, partial [Polyangiaceae bacterium]|nr:hypothetical protein [Polyangiaceae bacterium]